MQKVNLIIGKRWLLAGGTLAFSAGICFLLFFQTGSGALRRFSHECIGCHLKSALNIDGPMASQLSKGVHTVKPGFPIGWNHEQETQVLTGKECKSCHEQAYATWQQSNHAQAFSNAIFRAGLERENHAWCVNCHGPLWQPDKVTLKAATESKRPLGELHETGVACVVCHMRNGQIYTKGNQLHQDKNLFHRLLPDPKLGSANFCAGCHQFNFPKEIEPVIAYEIHNPMQNTIDEYREVTSEKIPCHSCHISGRDHSLHPKGQLQKLLKYAIKTTRIGKESLVEFQIRIDNLGHNFPTGDLFRILSLYVVNANQEEIFRKDFRKEVRVVDRELVADSTLKPDKTTLIAKSATIFSTSENGLICQIVYRRQGAIENEPGKLPMARELHRTTIYSGPCNTSN